MTESFKIFIKITLLFLVLVGFPTITGHLLFNQPVADSNDFHVKYLLFQILIDLNFVVVILLSFKILNVNVSHKINIKNLNYKTLILIVFIGFFFFVIDPVLLPKLFFQKLKSGKLDLFMAHIPKLDTGADIYLFIKTTVFAPLYEEIFYRGIVFDNLKKHFGAVAGILISSALFSISHLELTSFLQFFVAGMLLSYIYYKTRNLTYPMLLHSTGNLLVNFSLNNEVIYSSYSFLPLGFYIFSIASLFFCIYLVSSHTKKISNKYNSE